MRFERIIPGTLILILLLIPFSVLFSQESLQPLQYNPWLGGGQLKQKQLVQSNTPLALPFIDDFSKTSVFPDAGLWSDAHVFVNNVMAKYPPSQGVATFDALNDTGAIYPDASPFPFVADYLTSQYIDLSPYAAIDSLYFSFFYQPAGLGNKPELQDSLVLEFLEEYRADTLVDTTVNPPDTVYIDRWRSIWHAEGMELDTFYHQHKSWFRQVMIPVTDTIFFRNDFRFRFYSYASLAAASIPSWRSNADFWHIDYVYLNSNRTLGDTLFTDLTFVNTAPGFLKRYASMPMRQYLANPAQETRDSVEMLISNLGKDLQSYEFKFNVSDLNATLVFDTNYGYTNIDPFYVSGYQTYPTHRYPKFPGFVFPGQGNDSAAFNITYIIQKVGIGQEFIRQNDTLRATQYFHNYLAYDDGIPEAGYGLSPAGSLLAVKFRLNTPDTLRGVQMFFNRTVGNSSQRNFKLVVWADDKGLPGEVLYQSSKYLKPLYQGGRNAFQTYELDTETPLVLGPDKLTFYVGWVQQTDDNLNIGFDADTNAQKVVYYNIEGKWQVSSYQGYVMMRPCIGPSLEPPKKGIAPAGHFQLSIYPNPTSGHFTLNLPPASGKYDGPSDYVLHIFNLLGEKVTSLPYQASFDLSFLGRGVYILQLSTFDNYLNYQAKVVITK
ncbi:MAG TPA: T9SS type A sorting domain-containing protein [Bacteroidales bacterium]|nr:T9SS type A sorting domain-containing protein [Bacteroidales bacterium]HSA44579.1 T9SS type A sorting domain-containing protein [Bacteroidales bacterium]